MLQDCKVLQDNANLREESMKEVFIKWLKRVLHTHTYVSVKQGDLFGQSRRMAAGFYVTQRCTECGKIETFIERF